MGATVHIHRPKAKWKDRARSYKIVSDEKVVAEVKNGDSISFQVEPGQEHTIYAKIDWTKSNPVIVSLSEGDEVHLGVANDVNMMRFLGGPEGIIRVLVAEKNSYLSLGPVEPPGS